MRSNIQPKHAPQEGGGGTQPTGTNTTPRAAQTPDAGERVADRVRGILGARAWADWFEGRAAFGADGADLTVGLGSPFVLNFVKRRFTPLLLGAARAELGPHAAVHFEVDGSLLQLPLEGESGGESEPGDVPRSRGAATPRLPPARPRRLADLNDFLASDENELALAAAHRLCGGAGTSLFLYGGTGLGKTHLLEGVLARQRRAGRTAVLLTAESFGNQFTEALRTKSLPVFRRKFRTLDLLLVDDVGFFEGKAGFCEEFLHTLQEMERRGRRFAVSAARHPRLLTGLPDELLTRLSGGTVCRIAPPDDATRTALVRRKLAGRDLPLPDDAVRWVAGKFRGSVRQLEGALNVLETWRELTGRKPGLSAVRRVLVDLERDCAKRVRMTDVERAVCEEFGVTEDRLRGPGRARTESRPRMIAMYLTRKHTGTAYREIGRHFGGRNHSTVLAAERNVTRWLSGEKTPPGFDAAAAVRDVEERLRVA